MPNKIIMKFIFFLHFFRHIRDLEQLYRTWRNSKREIKKKYLEEEARKQERNGGNEKNITKILVVMMWRQDKRKKVKVGTL